ncbi:hypothetical protein PIB30_101843, partial [Stylosanthes scabra]|nr:hypothetical protein [Stylosanthes scabra]
MHPFSQHVPPPHHNTKTVTPSSHVWHGTNAVLAFLSHDRATTSLPSPCIQAYHALLSRLARHQRGPCFNPTFSTKLHTQSPVHPFPHPLTFGMGKTRSKPVHHTSFISFLPSTSP